MSPDKYYAAAATGQPPFNPPLPPTPHRQINSPACFREDLEADADADAEGEDADAADAPSVGEFDFNQARRHTLEVITQRDSPHRQEAGRRAFRPLQDMEEKDVGEAPLTHTKNGIQ